MDEYCDLSQWPFVRFVSFKVIKEKTYSCTRILAHTYTGIHRHTQAYTNPHIIAFPDYMFGMQ